MLGWRRFRFVSETLEERMQTMYRSYDDWKTTEPRTIADLISDLPDDLDWPDDDPSYSDFQDRVFDLDDSDE